MRRGGRLRKYNFVQKISLLRGVFVGHNHGKNQYDNTSLLKRSITLLFASSLAPHLIHSPPQSFSKLSVLVSLLGLVARSITFCFW